MGTFSEVTFAPPRRRNLGPLQEPLFRGLWAAALVSYTGTWMQNVGAGWLMTSLTMSPLMVGLVQAAGAIPVFVVVLPAGALADMVDRRRLLLFTQSWMVVAAAVVVATALVVAAVCAASMFAVNGVAKMLRELENAAVFAAISVA